MVRSCRDYSMYLNREPENPYTGAHEVSRFSSSSVWKHSCPLRCPGQCCLSFSFFHKSVGLIVTVIRVSTVYRLIEYTEVNIRLNRYCRGYEHMSESKHILIRRCPSDPELRPEQQSVLTQRRPGQRSVWLYTVLDRAQLM